MDTERPETRETAEPREIDLGALIRDVPDFPQPGVLFKDITTLTKDGAALHQTVNRLTRPFRGAGIDRVVGIESRGFIFAGAVAYLLEAGFVPVRKEGKLPAVSIKREYSLEYGTNVLEMHRDAIEPGHTVLIVDDVLATGGTALATAHLVESLGGKVAGMAFVVELGFLKGREHLQDYRLLSLVTY
jgi:adenine phosphoribosyltransferase